MISPTIVKQLLKTRDWKAVQAHIVEEIAKLDTLAGINYSDPVAAAVEGRARQAAAEKLREILKPFVEPSEIEDPDANMKDKLEDTGLL